MDRKGEYRSYLHTEEWEKLRLVALAGTNGKCAFCDEDAVNVHHVKYPKRFAEDSIFNVVPTCKRCHEIAHGIPQMIELENVTRMQELTPFGDPFPHLISAGKVYASVDSYTKALHIPTHKHHYFVESFKIRAMTGKLPKEPDSYKGVPVYRWQVASIVLLELHDEFVKKPYDVKRKDEWILEKAHDDRFRDYYFWLSDVGEKALASALKLASTDLVSQPAGTPIRRTDEQLVEIFSRGIAPRLHLIDEKIGEHDVLISSTRRSIPALRDASKPITVEQAFIELARLSKAQPLAPISKLNAGQLVAQLLLKIGVVPGRKIPERIADSNRVIEANTYPRGEIYKAIREICGDDDV